MFLSRYKKNNIYPCKPQFYYIKVGFKGVKITQACFRAENFSSENFQFFGGEFFFIYLNRRVFVM